MALAAVRSIDHVVVGVESLAPAVAFYRDGLGFEVAGTDIWPDCPGAHVVLRAGASRIIVAEASRAGDIGGGAHQAYRMSEAGRDAALTRLSALGAEIHRYHESRPEEAEASPYVLDPSGNRVQLVCAGDAGADGIDHICLEDVNIEGAEAFYAGTLQLGVAHIAGARTADFVRARDWGDGRIDMMPGTCRWVRYFRPIKDQNRMQARPSLQMYFRAGTGTIGIFMAMEDYAEPPEEQVIGTPRIGLLVDEGGTDAVAARLDAAGHPFTGPVAHEAGAPLARSLYCRDGGGNFIAFCEEARNS